MTRILVTGATGFVGRRLCESLIEDGHRVTAAVRSPDRSRFLPAGVATCVTGDLESFAKWPSLLRGHDAVIHLAARTHVMREQAADPHPAYRRINVQGTSGLVRGCAAAGVRRFVYVSSIKAVGEGAAFAYEEAHPCYPSDDYGRTKREAEELLMHELSRHDCQWTVIRPPLVYGPGVRGNVERILRAVGKGIPLPLAGIQNARSMVFLDNLVSALEASVWHPAAANQVFHVADDRPLSTTEFIQHLAAGMGRRARLFYVPAFALQTALGLLGRRFEAERLLGSLTMSNEKLKRMLDWAPAISAECGAFLTGRWFASSLSGHAREDAPARPPRRSAA